MALHILGITDEQTTCDHCGRTELRSTVILADDENTETGRYGSTCAARELTRANGTHHTGTATLNAARTREHIRRNDVKECMRTAISHARTGDHVGAMWWRNQAENNGLIRPDEIALNERLLTWARAYRRGQAEVWQ